MGVSASRALTYDYGPGRAQEHHRPHRVAGTCMGRDWRERARRMDTRLREHGDTARGSKGRVIRLAVAAAPEDRVLTDREWGRIAARTVDGYTGGRADEHTWEAVRHDPRHIHITLLQRDHEGQLLNLWRDKTRNLALCEKLEREHALERRLDPERSRARDRSRSRETVAARRDQQRCAHSMQRQRGTLSQQAQRAQDVQGREQAADQHPAEPASKRGHVRDASAQEFSPPPGWDGMNRGQRAAWLRANDPDEYARRVQRGQKRLEAYRADQQRREHHQRQEPDAQRSRPTQQQREPDRDPGPEHGHEQGFSPPPGWSQLSRPRQLAWLRANAPDEYRQRIERGQDRLDAYRIAQSRPRDWDGWSRERQHAWETQQRERIARERQRQAQRERDRERERGRDGHGLER